MLHYRSILCGAGIAMLAAIARGDEAPLSTAVLRTSVESAAPGRNFTLGLEFTMREGWHTYTEEPGDSGMPPDITIRSPQGLRVGNWRFPAWQTFTDAAGTTYGYEDTVILLSRVHVPAGVPTGSTVEIEMDVTWLVCKDVCIPVSDTLRITLSVEDDGGTERSDWQAILERGGWAASRE